MSYNPKTLTTRQKLMNEKEMHWFEVAIFNAVIDNEFSEPWRFHIKADQKHYTKEAMFRRAQDEGVIPLNAEIYFDGKYLCDVNEEMNPDQMKARINYNLLRIMGGGNEFGDGSSVLYGPNGEKITSS